VSAVLHAILSKLWRAMDARRKSIIVWAASVIRMCISRCRGAMQAAWSTGRCLSNDTSGSRDLADQQSRWIKREGSRGSEVEMERYPVSRTTSAGCRCRSWWFLLYAPRVHQDMCTMCLGSCFSQIAVVRYHLWMSCSARMVCSGRDGLRVQSIAVHPCDVGPKQKV
jgi:hypothetical protein